VPTLLISLAVVTSAAGDDAYVNDVRPLLQSKCVPCHGSLRAEADLRLDAGQLIHDAGVINASHPESSFLLERVTAADDERMPPADEADRLSPAQIRVLSEWVRSGARWPTDEKVPDGPDKHWAYQPIERPLVPSASKHGKQTHPIDAFLAVKRSDAGIEAGPMAERTLLVRRIYLDVLGLPPTPAQQHAFISGQQSWNELVDSLLSDPAYGQRWGRHWMDVWRYSDWDGFKQQVRGSQRHIWRWRDWIIESLNDDKPYDQMILEMLAGDEVAPQDPLVWRATGFLVRNFHWNNRNIWLDATVEHTSKAFLAMTMDCARCHDHKYDPISQMDYYKLRAVFEPHHVRTERIAGQPKLVLDGIPRVYDADLDAATFLYHGGDEKRPDKTNPIAPAVPDRFHLPLNPVPVSLPLTARVPDLRPFVEKESLAAAENALRKAVSNASKSKTELAIKAREVARKNLAALRARWQSDRAIHECESTNANPTSGQQSDGDHPKLAALRDAAIAAEHAWRIAQAEAKVIQTKADFAAVKKANPEPDQNRKAEIRKANVALNKAIKEVDQLRETAPSTYTPVVKTFPSQSSGRRLALAKWITHPQNPFTARVAVNHIWLRHFGQPLVENVFDFGLRSPRPKHDQLLDWLADELIQSRWSMKHVHRLILSSHAYQLAPPTAHPDAKTQRQRDPDNEFYWHFKPRRLEAEIVRDSLLHVAGNLDLAHGGPEIDFQKGEIETRRSVYFGHAYEKQMTMLVTFDAANPTDCYRRSPSVIPQQALAMSNSPLAISQSRSLGRQLNAQSDSDTLFIKSAFRSVLARAPTEMELQACESFLANQTSKLQQLRRVAVQGNAPQAGATEASTAQASAAETKPNATASVPAADDPADRAKENLIHVLINHNDFVTVR
tara:strand:+ start:22645 stop:25335 length:2691 start_codon:yes stop_codon:yes gene_type:complete